MNPIVGNRVMMSGISFGEKLMINSVLRAKLDIKRIKCFLFINIKVVSFHDTTKKRSPDDKCTLKYKLLKRLPSPGYCD